jgi:hypothetical protein
MHIEACKEWPRGKVDPSFSTPVKSSVPVLMISGDLDPVTPPWIAERAARYLPNARQIVFRYGSHAGAASCGEDLIAEFVSKGTAKGLDASCVSQIHRPPFNLGEMAARPASSTESPEATKTKWEGVLDVGAAKLRLVLNVAKAADGSAAATVDSPDQGANGLPVDSINFNGATVHFEMGSIGASYNGSLSSDGVVITGRWEQGGRSWPLVLKRTDNR